MARISTYQKDTSVTKNDKVIGTDSTGSVTKNFKLQDIAGFLRNTNSVGIATQLNFKFVTSNRTIQTISFDALGGNNTTFDNVTEFVLSKFDSENNNISEYLKTYRGNELLIVQLNDYSNFGSFNINSIEDHPSLPDYFIVSVTNTNNQGRFIADQYYGLANISKGEEDKKYVHTQGVPSAIWNINHNLNKFPSVTSVNNNNIEAKGMIQYTDKNNLTITFSAGFSGKAYLN